MATEVCVERQERVNRWVPEEPFGSFAVKGLKRAWLGVVRSAPTRRLALWLRRPLKRRLGDWIDTRIWGLNLRLRTAGNLSEERLIYMPKHLDWAEREALAREVGDGEVFLDVGANAGVYSLWMASFRRRGVRVEAFEPDPELCARFRANLRRNDLNNVTLHECALGAKEGHAALTRVEGNLGENSLVSGGSGECVPVRTLNSVLRERGIGSVAAIKIDVEGGERSVLEGWFATTSPEFRPRMVICEWMPGQADPEVVLLLREAGYGIVGHGRLNGIFKRN